MRILLLLLFLNNIVYSAPSDSLLLFSELNFKTDFEKNTFKNYFFNNKKTDLIDLFLTPYLSNDGYNSIEAHKQINDFVEILKKETANQSEEKKIKTIYKKVHKHFFKVYKLQNSFSDIFEKGEYNCVSGSAMYAIVFQLMGIPYQIIEAPQHVFLVAYPNTHKILIETTSPENGYHIFTPGYIDKFIKYLRDSKLISEDEFQKSTAEKLFQKYYFINNGLSLIELAGVQYCNYSVYFSEENNNEKAFDAIVKAYLLWPGERHKYVLQWLTSYMTSNSEYKESKDIQRLLILCRFNNLNDNEVADERIKNEFRKVMRTQLIGNSNFEEAEKSFNSIYNSLKDTVLKNEISYEYNYELARLGYLNYKNQVYETKYLKAAYKNNPKNMDLQNLIKAYFGREIEKTSGPGAIIKQIDETVKYFPFLNNDNWFNNTKSNAILELAYQSFMLNEIKKGETYLTEFETFCTKNENVKPNERFVEKAYSTVASYYYKKGNIVKTKQYLKTGIIYAPENFGLIIRLNQIR